MADFERDHAAGRDQRGELRDDLPVTVEAVHACEQRLGRLPIAHLGIKRRILFDIRRVAQDQIELCADPLCPVAFKEFSATGRDPVGIGARNGHRPGAPGH
jgi:hypothetical protein